MDICVCNWQGCDVLMIRPLTAVMLLSLVAPSAHASDRATADTATAPGSTAARPGVSSLFWSPTPEPARAGMSAEQAARFHLEHHRKDLGKGLTVSRSALAGLRTRFVHDTGRGGKIVGLRQSVAGVELFHADIKVLLDRSHRLLGISGAPHPAAHAASARPFVHGPVDAVTRAMRDLHRELPAPRVSPTGVTRAGYTYFDIAPTQGLRQRRPARVKPVYVPVGEALVPAHVVELQLQPGTRTAEVFRYVVAADDGRVLERSDLTANEAFQYRVYADASPETDHRPFDGPLVDFTPHPTGIPGVGPKAPIASNLISMEGFNTNPDGVPDPWLPAGATETKGNNVDAYADHTNPNGFNPDQTEFRAKVTSPGVFDHSFDISQEPLASQTQSMAATTDLFYVVNWMHDWWYDSGFVEATGNAQADNYGRGGVGNDALLAEAQDAALLGTRNNANMATPADGESPRMQMYLWTPLVQNSLSIAPLNQNFAVTTASFGPKNYDVTATLVLVDDGAGVSVNDGCEDPINDVAGKIALIDRGNCSFETKSSKAQAAGAVGVLIANNVDGALNPGVDNMVVDPTIPTQAVSKVDGAALKAALLLLPQTAHMVGSATVERDGTVDNMIVAHEWGHFIHHRLVDCGQNQCRAQSEGWGDFNALMMALRDGDDLAGAYGSAPYATFDGTGFFGLRRFTYSTDPTKNSIGLRHIADGEPLPVDIPLGPAGGPNSEVHNAGEVWATMMWEAYIAVIQAHPGLDFESVRRIMGDHIVAGMLLAPTDPTYTEQRDAILMAMHAADPGDFQVAAAAFAKRGAGSCAVSPPRASKDFLGVVEDFELRGAGSILGVSLSDDQFSCDDDGVVDVGELGTLKVTVQNHGAAATLKGSTVEIVDPHPSLVLPESASVGLAALEPYEQVIAEIPLAVDEALVDHLPIAITIRLTTPEGCEETLETFLRADLNGDVALATSTLEDVETPNTVWVTGGTEEDDAVWARLASPDGYTWHGTDVGRVSDTWLESPTLLASDTDSLIFTWDHSYSFEFSDNINWDGGVLEISGDDGVTWEDVSVYTAAGYNGAIASAANPLDKRPAFVHQNPSYPASDPHILDFGTAFAGKSVKLRFRIGTDAAAGDVGWDIDNIAVDGITNTPFSTWIPDQTECVLPETTGDTSSSSGDSSSTGGDSSSTGGTTTTTDGSSTSDTSASASDTGTTEAITITSSGGNTDDTGIDTNEPTTGSMTSGILTTTATGTGGAETGTPEPTSSPTGVPTEGGGDDVTGANSSGSTGDTVGETIDDGCGCRLDGQGGNGWLQVVPWLGLMALRRRRPRA